MYVAKDEASIHQYNGSSSILIVTIKKNLFTAFMPYDERNQQRNTAIMYLPVNTHQMARDDFIFPRTAFT